MLSTKLEQNYENVTITRRHTSEALKPQCLLDYNSAKKCVDYSAQIEANYSPLCNVRKWYKSKHIKDSWEKLYWTPWFVSVQRNSFQWNTSSNHCSSHFWPEKKYMKMQTSTMGTRLDHVLFYVLESSRLVRKYWRSCYEDISQIDCSGASGSGWGTMCENCVASGRVSLIFVLAESEEIT